jgi:hypothetical protein
LRKNKVKDLPKCRCFIASENKQAETNQWICNAQKLSILNKSSSLSLRSCFMTVQIIRVLMINMGTGKGIWLSVSTTAPLKGCADLIYLWKGTYQTLKQKKIESILIIIILSWILQLDQSKKVLNCLNITL